MTSNQVAWANAQANKQQAEAATSNAESNRIQANVAKSREKRASWTDWISTIMR